MVNIETLKLKLINICKDLGIDFNEMSDPVSKKDDSIHMTFSFSEENIVDALIKTIRSSIAKFSPERSLHDDADDQDIGVNIEKSFIRSRRCWSLTVCLSDDKYEFRETVQA